MQDNQNIKLLHAAIDKNEKAIDFLENDLIKIDEAIKYIVAEVFGIIDEKDRELLQEFLGFKKMEKQLKESKKTEEKLEIDEETLKSMELERSDIKHSKKLYISLNKFISSLYDKVQDKPKPGQGEADYIFEKNEKLLEKFFRELKNSGLALEYTLVLLSKLELKRTNSNSIKFDILSRELDSKGYDFGVKIKGKKENKNNLSYFYNIGTQLTVSNPTNLNDKYRKIQEQLEVIDKNGTKIKGYSPDMISLIVINGKIGEIVKRQTNSGAEYKNSFSNAINKYIESNFNIPLLECFNDYEKEEVKELDLIQRSLINIYKELDKYIIKNDLSKIESIEEIKFGDYKLKIKFDEKSSTINLSIIENGNEEALYYVDFFITQKLIKKLEKNYKIKENRQVNSKPGIRTKSIKSNLEKEEQKILDYINIFLESGELIGEINTDDLINIYASYPLAREECKKRIQENINKQEGFDKKIRYLIMVYNKSPENGGLKEELEKNITDISIKNNKISEETKKYYLNYINNEKTNNKGQSISVYILFLKILSEKMDNIRELKELFKTIEKRKNIIKEKEKLDYLVDNILERIKNHKDIIRKKREDKIDDMIFLYEKSCCTTRGAEYRNSILEMYSEENIQSFPLDKLRKLWKFDNETSIYIDSLNIFSEKSENFSDFSELIIQLTKQINSLNKRKDNLNKDLEKKEESNNKSYKINDEIEKIEEIISKLKELKEETIKEQKKSIKNYPDALSYYRSYKDESILIELIEKYSKSYKEYTELYNLLDINKYPLYKKDIMKNRIEKLILENRNDSDLEKEIKKYIDELGKIYLEVKNTFQDKNLVEDIVNKIKKIINSFESGIKISIYLNKKSKSLSQFIEINKKLFDSIESYLSDENLESEEKIEKYIMLKENFKEKREYCDEKMKEVVNDEKSLLNICSHKKNDKNYIRELIEEKLGNICKESGINEDETDEGIEYIISSFEIGYKIYLETYKNDLVYEKLIELISNINEANLFYTEAKSDEDKKKIIYKKIEFFSQIDSFSEVEDLYEETKKLFGENSDQTENILGKTFTNIKKLNNNGESKKFEILFFLYENSSQKFLRERLDEDMIENDMEILSSYRLYKLIKDKETSINDKVEKILNKISNNILNKIICTLKSKKIDKSEEENIASLINLLKSEQEEELLSKIEEKIDSPELYFILKNIYYKKLESIIENKSIKEKIKALYKKALSIKKRIGEGKQDESEIYEDEFENIEEADREFLEQFGDKLRDGISRKEIEEKKQSESINLELGAFIDIIENIRIKIIRKTLGERNKKLLEKVKDYLNNGYKYDTKLYFKINGSNKNKEKKPEDKSNASFLFLKNELEETSTIKTKKEIVEKMRNLEEISFDEIHYIYKINQSQLFEREIREKNKLSKQMQKSAKSFEEHYIVINLENYSSFTNSQKKETENNLLESIKNIRHILLSYDKIGNKSKVICKIKDHISNNNILDSLNITKNNLEISKNIIDIAINNEEFKDIQFSDWKKIYNSIIRNKESYKKYNKDIFKKLILSSKTTDDYMDLMSIYDNNNNLDEESLEDLKNVINNKLMRHKNGIDYITNRIRDVKNDKLKNFIKSIIKDYYLDIDNIIFSLESTKLNKKQGLVYKGTKVLFIQDMIENDKIYNIYKYLEEKGEKTVFIKKIENLLDSKKFFDNDNSEISDELINEILSLFDLEDELSIDFRKNLDDKKLKKELLENNKEKWKSLKKYSDIKNDKLYYIIFSKTILNP